MCNYWLNFVWEFIICNWLMYNMNIFEIVYEVGFNDFKYFICCFIKYFGIIFSLMMENGID